MTCFLPFEMAVKLGGARAVMPAYHDIDGEPISASRHYLSEVLRGQWGFDGLVVSDYEAVASRRRPSSRVMRRKRRRSP
jgi:beta-glucosidase